MDIIHCFHNLWSQVLWNTKEWKNKPAHNSTWITNTLWGISTGFGGNFVYAGCHINIFFFSETGSVLACEFSITSNFSLFPDSNSTAQQFDLNVNKTYIIMAQGLLDDNMTFMWDNFAFFTNGTLFNSFLFYIFSGSMVKQEMTVLQQI